MQIRSEINYRKLGYRRGVFHVYLKGNSVREVAEKIAEIKGILNVGLFIGDSDIVGVFIFKEASEILSLKNKIRKIRGVKRIVWTEEVFALPEKNVLLVP